MEFTLIIGFGAIIWLWLSRNSLNKPSASEKSDSTIEQGRVGSAEGENSSDNTKVGHRREARESLIESAIREGVRVRFRYLDQDGEITTRTVTPIYLERRHDSKILCLTAFCHLRAANRTFVVHRMQDLEIRRDAKR
jgi:predicted DNA-binding transcriptional regulator YafY